MIGLWGKYCYYPSFTNEKMKNRAVSLVKIFHPLTFISLNVPTFHPVAQDFKLCVIFDSFILCLPIANPLSGPVVSSKYPPNQNLSTFFNACCYYPSLSYHHLLTGLLLSLLLLSPLIYSSTDGQNDVLKM